MEVETAQLFSALIPEPSITPILAESPRFLDKKTETLYLLPSPELPMKRLLADGWGDIFQFSRSFRGAEPEDRLHMREFTLLEWYLAGKDYRDNIAVCEELLRALLKLSAHFVFTGSAESSKPELSLPIPRVSMNEQFKRALGLDLKELLADPQKMLAAARNVLSADIDGRSSVDDLFNRIFVDRIEPSLPQTVFLTDYPAAVPTTAAAGADGIFAERWELYINRIEVANCYTEERNRDAARRQCENAERLMENLGNRYPVDGGIPETFEKMPPCSGAALGVERLLYALWGGEAVSDYLPYSAW